MSHHLSTLSELPDADVVIYDGNCQFCRRQVERLAWLDGGNRLAFVSLHDPVVGQRFPDLTHDQMMQQMYVVDQAGHQYGGAAAIRYLSRRLPRMWVLAPLLHIPGTMPIWRWAYQNIAVRRYRWNQSPADQACEEDGACKIHLK
jgi:predicted DCC family thiol-disulfide oxidoreductase YuxK